MLFVSPIKSRIQSILSGFLAVSVLALPLLALAEAPAVTPTGNGGNITIRSDKQIFAQDQNLVRAVGNVSIQKDNTTASSPEAIIMLGEGGAASKVIFVRGATLNQGARKMTAERIVINSSDNTVYAENNVVTTIQTKNDSGQPTTVKVKSDTQQAHSDTGELFANGHVDIKYDDFSAKGPKAVFHTKNNELEKIVMNGRSQVEDNDRRVTGDTVVITTKPKQFNADGNVTTQIKSKSKTIPLQI